MLILLYFNLSSILNASTRNWVFLYCSIGTFSTTLYRTPPKIMFVLQYPSVSTGGSRVTVYRQRAAGCTSSRLVAWSWTQRQRGGRRSSFFKKLQKLAGEPIQRVPCTWWPSTDFEVTTCWYETVFQGGKLTTFSSGSPTSCMVAS